MALRRHLFRPSLASNPLPTPFAPVLEEVKL